jgi:diguanylate cyclase (GGDEF)-like protein
MQTVLIADDHRANRDALRHLLEHAGYQVLMAANGAEALAMALEHRPDLVISDVLMPAMDGYGLARRLRAHPSTAATRLMFYTAYFDRPEAKELAQAHGVARVLAKPSDNDAILGAVREALAAQAAPLAAVAPDLDRDRLRMMVDQLLEKTNALEAERRRVESLNRTLSVLSAVNALVARLPERQALLEEACRIAVEKGGFGFASIDLRDGVKEFSVSHGDADEVLPAEMVLPLKVSPELTGSLRLRARSADFFDDEEKRLLNELAADLSFALHHLAQKARMDYLACHDTLTDLPNRGLFADRMAQALGAARRERRFAAAVFLDVERFRMVNETLGRKGGDGLLREVARRLVAAAREQDTVARVGADHFAIAVAGFDHPGDATHFFMERLEREFATPVVIDGVELLVTLKAGVAVFPTDGESAETLCGNAETALRKAKDSGQRYLFYAPHMNAKVAESLAMEHRLRRALDEGRLALHYQPKVDVRSGRLAGLEALIRWHDPELGVVPPSRFVQLMEETGMILAAGRWALGRAVADIRHWQKLGLDVPRTSVNVSALQLRQEDFTDSVLQAIAVFGDQVPLLDLEITESVLVDEDCTRKLQILRHTGIEVAVDDFGTGYCSLSYLARLPVDILKIDRSFVVRMREAGYPRNIVAMIVSLAHTLGLKVVAEGVEEDEQMRMLRDLGCDQIQGYLVSWPLPPAQIESLLRGEATRTGAAHWQTAA